MSAASLKKTAKSRSAAQLSENLDKNLGAYAIAAAAAGVSILAGVRPSEAEVIYTPKHITLGHAQNEGGPVVYPIDFKNDGIADLNLVSFAGATTNLAAASLEVYPCYCKTPNSVVGMRRAQSESAFALPAGVQVGPGQPFVASNVRVRLALQENRHRTSTVGKSYFQGQWANGGKGVKNHYLGVKFLISGEVHYGWVRLTISKNPLLTGWAYETEANAPIVTGFPQSNGPGAIGEESNSPASLGVLARGADGLPMWRTD
jgi:hypothetical protein